EAEAAPRSERPRAGERGAAESRSEGAEALSAPSPRINENAEEVPVLADRDGLGRSRGAEERPGDLLQGGLRRRRLRERRQDRFETRHGELPGEHVRIV